MKRFPLTLLLLASLLIGFAIELAAGALGNESRLLSLGALPHAHPLGREYWRLLAYAWLHASYLHLVTNALLLWWVGRIVERRVLAPAMLGLYLACAVAGGLLIVWRASQQPGPGISLGASAAVSGLLTCALVLLHRPEAVRRFAYPRGVRGVLWATFAIGIAISFIPGVSLAGHAGGLIVGVLLGFVMPLRDAEPAGATSS